MNESFKLFNDETTLVNLKDERKCSVFIGRPSKWGNRWSHLKNAYAEYVPNRKEAIEKYRVWILNNKELMSDLESLRGQTLGCFCCNSDEVRPSDPYVCHGQVLLELLKKTSKK